MSTLLYNSLVINNSNHVGIFNCRKAVRNYKCGTALRKFIKRMLDFNFCGCIKRRSCFI